MHMPNGSSADTILTVSPEQLTDLLWRRLEPERWPLKPSQLPEGAVLVGGAVRDGLLNRLPPCPDLDLVVPGAVLGTVQRPAREHGGACVVLDEQRQMARLVLKGWTIDFARLEGDDLTEDLFRRDFRLNAIALSLSAGSSRRADLCHPGEQSPRRPLAPAARTSVDGRTGDAH